MDATLQAQASPVPVQQMMVMSPGPLADGVGTSEHAKITNAGNTADLGMIASGLPLVLSMLKGADIPQQLQIAVLIFCGALFAVCFLTKAWLMRAYSKDRTALKIASLPSAVGRIAPLLILCALLLTLAGCAGSSTGNQDKSLNAALDEAKRRTKEYQTNQEAISAKEEAALLAAQQAAIAGNLKVGLANWQLICAQKDIPAAEMASETARLYSAANTEQANALQSFNQLQQIRTASSRDIDTSNALITQVEAANSSTPVTTTSFLTTLVQQLQPVANGAAASLNLSTPNSSATVPTISRPLRGTVAEPVQGGAVVVPQPATK